MAKILQGPEYQRVTCKECRATIGYLPEDIEIYRVTDYTGSSDEYKRVKCPRPNCGGYGYIR